MASWFLGLILEKEKVLMSDCIPKWKYPDSLIVYFLHDLILLLLFSCPFSVIRLECVTEAEEFRFCDVRHVARLLILCCLFFYISALIFKPSQEQSFGILFLVDLVSSMIFFEFYNVSKKVQCVCCSRNVHTQTLTLIMKNNLEYNLQYLSFKV